MTMRNLPPEDAERVLSDTKMDIMIAAQRDNEIGFYSTHRSNVSWFVLALVEPLDIEVWEVTGASREARINMETNIRNHMDAEHRRRQE